MPKISQLPVATQVNTPDLFAIVQAGVTKQATGSLVAAMVGTGLTIPITSVTGLSAALAACLQASANLSDVANAGTARINLGLPALSNGQLWIGSTGIAPLAANITAGSGISVSNGAGTISISASGAGTSWTEVTGTTQSMSTNAGYVSSNGSLVTLTLPTVSSFGDVIYMVGKGAGGWSITYTTNQQIRIGSSASTLTTGNIASTNQYDSIAMVCTTANLVWTTLGAPQGIITVA